MACTTWQTVLEAVDVPLASSLLDRTVMVQSGYFRSIFEEQVWANALVTASTLRNDNDARLFAHFAGFGSYGGSCS